MLPDQTGEWVHSSSASHVTRNVRKWPLILAVLLAVAFATGAQESPDPGIKDPSRFDPNRPLARELETSIADGFTLVAVGDCITSRQVSQYANREDGFAKVLKILHQGDTTYGNLETSILDLRQFRGYPYTGQDDMPLVADPAVAKDLAAMGFRIMSRANNHAVDWGIEGMRETSHWLDDAGLVWAGAGENQGQARAAHYFESSKGRVAIVSMASTFRPTTEALPQQGAAPARPGINTLAVKKTTVVPPEVMKDLVGLEHQLYPNEKTKSKAESSSEVPNKLTLFGAKFELGTKFGYRYQMDAVDLGGILKSIRQGKQHSDFLIATIHSHESANSNGPDPQNDFDDVPADFVHELAKAAIDAGADTFLTTGIHHLGAIEIYKGRPIFYGLGNFFWSDIQEPNPADLYQQYRDSITQAFNNPEKATDADVNNALNAIAFAGPLPFESVITESRFDHGRLAEIRLYPLDLGYGMKLTKSGFPRLASAETGRKILQRLQAISAPYGTKIEIENLPPLNYVGVIRP